jgi:hypothetical protein
MGRRGRKGKQLLVDVKQRRGHSVWKIILTCRNNTIRNDDDYVRELLDTVMCNIHLKLEESEKSTVRRVLWRL